MKKLILLAATAAGALLVAQPAAAQQTVLRNTPANAPSSERRICRSEVETGSLARRTRRCFTRAEWDRFHRAARENAEYESDRQRTRSLGE